ncbi:PH domain-containing protein [Parasporobacterium paucivorans]|uniref:PH domain-containing protein n=1 Tax=Parasporobacterium paucivorans DSM 15970 TaxID=1122934 RepID=A0A1M6HWU6_9FIRM|nr:PH domain-containing protein [Parasporobacterium paucivorans]SHJ26633.1 PH domain-containing protein [Parasporobacterium paucivorans DSM 15970]
MIDFNNKGIIKLKGENISNGERVVGELLISGETVMGSYVAMRDRVVFTNKRIISCNVQGITGKKVDYTSIPYSKIQTYSVETAGTFDLDAELEVWLSGVGRVKFELAGGVDILALCKSISEYIFK